MPRAARVVGLGDLRKLLRIAEQDEVRGGEPTAAASASANWPASSMNRRSNSSRCSSRANSHAVPATSWWSSVTSSLSSPWSIRPWGSRIRRPCRCRRTSGPLVRAALDLAQQVLDRGVAWRGDADAPAGRERRDDHPRAAECLACPGGPWTGRTEWSSPRVAETSASMSSPSAPDVGAAARGAAARARRGTGSSPASTRRPGPSAPRGGPRRGSPSRRRALPASGPDASCRGGARRGSPRRRRRCSSRRSWGRPRRPA